MSLVAVWVIVALGAGILEVVVPAFGFVFVTLAALLAAVLALLAFGLTTQVVVFAASALLFLLVAAAVLRARGSAAAPACRRAPRRSPASSPRSPTPIDPVRGSGRVNVEGHDWAARASVAIPAGAPVRVDGADGIVLLVSPVQIEEARHGRHRLRSCSSILVLFALVVLAKSIKIVPQKQVKLIERLGKFHKRAEAGLNVIVPFIDSVRATIDLREQITQIEPQSVITRDNVTMEVDAVIYYVIADPVRATYEVQNLTLGRRAAHPLGACAT